MSSPFTTYEARGDGVCLVTQPISDVSKEHVGQLCRILDAETEVALITGSLDSGSPLRERYPITEIPFDGPGESILAAAVGFVIAQVRMAAALVGRDESTVLFYGTTAYLLPIIVAQAAGRTVVVEPRGDVPMELEHEWRESIGGLAVIPATALRIVERIGFALADVVVTYTPAMARELDLDPEADGVYPDGARYVPEKFEQTTDWTDRDPVVGYVGRLEACKNPDRLVAIIKALPSEIGVRIVGDGAARENVEAALADEIDAGQVEMVGRVPHDDVPDELNDLRLLIHPASPTEGLPTAVVEAMACGTPAYITPVSGVPDVVVDGETGFLMPRDANAAPAAVAERAAEIATDPDTAAVAERAAALIEEEYRFDSAVARYAHLLHHLHRGADPQPATTATDTAQERVVP